MRARPEKYPVRLAKPMNLLVAAVRAHADKDPGSIEKWHREQEAELLLELLDYYGISRTERDCWIALALSLARTHVPAFRIERGERKKRGRKSNDWAREIHRIYWSIPIYQKSEAFRQWRMQHYLRNNKTNAITFMLEEFYAPPGASRAKAHTRAIQETKTALNRLIEYKKTLPKKKIGNSGK